MNGGQKLKSFNLHPIFEAPLALPAPYSVVIRLSLQNARKGRFSFLPETMSRQYTKRGKHGGACIPFCISPDSDRKSGDQLDPTHTAPSDLARIMATKRPAEGLADAPPPKRSALTLGPIDIGPATGEDDLNVKILQVGTRWRN